LSRIVRDTPPKWKWAFAVASVLILFGALAAQVDHERRLDGHKSPPGPNVQTIDLDFLANQRSLSAEAFYALGPLGQVSLGRDPTQSFITYSSGAYHVSLVTLGSGFSGQPGWQGHAGAGAPTVDGVNAHYEYLLPSTGANIVSGIDGVEFDLLLRSRTFVGAGDLSFDFALDMTPGLFPATGHGPLLPASTNSVTVSGAVPIKDATGREIFVITPARAIIDYRSTSIPAPSRSDVVYRDLFPAHQAADRDVVPLEYRLERTNGRLTLSVLLPTDLLLDPAINWPIRIDPGITNPISNSSYFADETILMDSDLVVTSSGAAQFSNVTLVMNRTSAPNYNISVAGVGRITLLSSTVKSNDSALPYRFTVNGSLIAQDTLVQHANDGLQLLGPSSTLSSVTLQNGTGRGLVIVGGNASLARVDIKGSLGTGLFSQAANLQTQFVNVTGSGGEGLYLNATSGNVTWSHILNSTLNGAKIVNASGINITHSEFAGSGRNGVLVIGGAPSLENSSVTANNWSGVALFDDHSAYLFGDLIAGNNWSGIETRLNSTADLYVNTVQGNAKAGVRVIASDPNIERNEIQNNNIGVWLEGAHNPGAKPGANASTEDGYAITMAASSRLGGGEMVPLVASVTIEHLGASTQSAVPPSTKTFSLRVTNTDGGGAPQPITLSIDSDERAWASLSTTSFTLAHGAHQDVTLTIIVPGGASVGYTYDVKVWANETLYPSPTASVQAFIDLQSTTTTTASIFSTGNNTTVPLSGILFSGGQPVSGKTIAFKLNGHWVGEATTNAGGLAVLSYTVSQPPLDQALEAHFNGTQYLVASTGYGAVNITWTASMLQAPDAQGRWGDPSSLTVRLLTTPAGYPAAGRPIYFSLAGSFQGMGYTDRDGNASWVFPDAVAPGTIAWNASFDEDPYTGNSANTSNFTSLKELTAIDGPSFTIRQGEVAYLAAVLTTDEGYALGSQTVEFKRGATSLDSVSTDASGYASLADTAASSLTEGDYSMTYVYAGDSHYLSLTHYLTLTVRRWVTSFNVTDQIEHYGDTQNLVAQLIDEAGTPLASETVGVYLNGTLLANVTTDGSGWATYSDTPIRLPKVYELKFKFDGDTRNVPVTAIVNLTVQREITKITVVVDTRIVLGAVLAITLRLTDDEGNPLTRFINVTLLDGPYANGTTDGSGYLTISFDSRGLLPQRYVLWYFFGGETNYTESQAYTRIVVEFDADLYGNTIEGNAIGVLANNSSSKLVGDTLRLNGDNLWVTNGSLLIYNSSVGLSWNSDYRLETGGSLYSTNTTFDHGKVIFTASAVLLHVRWILNILARDPYTRATLSGQPVKLYDSTEQLVFNKTTNADGWLGEEVVTEYVQNVSGKTRSTAHRLLFIAANLTLNMDVTRNMTLFRGNDSDLDGIPNAEENAKDEYWTEAEAHALEYTQARTDTDASAKLAIVSLPDDHRFLDPSSFPPFDAGTYVVMVRATSPVTNGTIRLSVSAANGTLLANQTFTPSALYRWYQVTPFVLLSGQELRINLTDESANPAQAAILVDEVVVAPLFSANGTRAHYPGQITDWLQTDTDKDGGADGAEVRAGTYWYEAESIALAGAVWVSRWQASNSWVVQHPAGNSTIVELNQTLVGRSGVFNVLIRGSGNITIERGIDGGSPVNTSLQLLGDSPAYQSYRFEYVAGHNFTLRIRDADDASGNLTDPHAWVDKVGLVLELQRPTVLASAPYGNASYAPADGTSPIYVGGRLEDGGEPILAWVNSTAILEMPLAALLANQSAIPTFSYSVGDHPTQPISFRIPLSANFSLSFLATTGGGKIYVFLMPFITQPWRVLDLNVPFPNAVLNGIAYSNGWIVVSANQGMLFGVSIDPSGMYLRFMNNSGLGDALGPATIYHDKAYFGFTSGMLAMTYNITAPAAQAWHIGPGQWPDPRDHCPPANLSCPPPGTYANVSRTFAGSIVYDVGSLFVLAYNQTETDLFEFTEDGQPIWALNLNWSWNNTAGNSTGPRLVIRNGAVVVLGPRLGVYDQATGALLMAHIFDSYPVNGFNMTASPVVTDREVVAPGPDGIYYFAFPNGTGYGDVFASDGNYTSGSVYPEDTLWKSNISSLVNAQPLLGDFDGSGYRDLIYTTSAGFGFQKDFEVGHRNYLELPQAGVDASHDENAQYLHPFVATDALDPDMDHDLLPDGREIGGWFGFAVVQAEDATEYQAWSDDPAAGGAKNFGFFHQFGVTLTADDGSVTLAPGMNSSWIRFETATPETGTFRMSLQSNTSVTQVTDLLYQHGNNTNPGTVDPSVGYGTGANLTGRVISPPSEQVDLTVGQLDRLRQVVENATYLKVRYKTMYPGASPDTFTSFGVKQVAHVAVYEARYDPNNASNMQVTVYIWMDIEFNLFGSLNASQARTYVFELGLNLSLVPWASLGGEALPANLSLLRILDLDRMVLSRFGLNAYNNDSDADGLQDGAEADGMPLSADADHDGLTDYQEIMVYHTNPMDRDTDHDGVRDGVEVGLSGNSTGWASIPEWVAVKYRGDPNFRPPSVNRTLPNYDADPSTTTDPLNPDTDAYENPAG
jgi:hypothetical protein